MNVTLKCNPYKKENCFIVNGKVYSKDSVLEQYTNMDIVYFQEQFCDDLVNELGSKKIDVEFVGSIYDYEELKSLTNKYNGNNDARINIIEKKIIENLSRRDKIDEIKNIILDSNIKEFEEENLVNKIKESLDKKTEIAVVSLVSSGKSTLINSLIGHKLMPSSSSACTATIVKLHHYPKREEFVMIKQNNEQYSEKVTLAEVKQINESAEINCVEIEGNIIGLESIANASLVDTPGTNNAADSNHQKITDEYIRGKDKPVVLLLIDKDQQTSNDLKVLLNNIADVMKSGGKIDEDRFIFILNKCDALDTNDNIEDIKQNQIDFIKSCGIKEPKIHFVSSYNALLARLNQNNKELLDSEIQKLESFIAAIRNEALEFYKSSIYSVKIKSDIEQRIFEINKRLSEKEDRLKDECINKMELVRQLNDKMIIQIMENKIEDLDKKKNLLQIFKDDSEYENDINELVLLKSGIRGVEMHIAEIVNKHKTIGLVKDIVIGCRDVLENRQIKSRIKNDIHEARDEKNEKEEYIRDITDNLEYKQLPLNFENEVKNIEFRDNLAKSTEAVNNEIRKLSEGLLSIKRSGRATNGFSPKRDIEYFIKEVERKVTFLKIDLENQYQNSIKYDMIKFSNSVINKYNEKRIEIINRIESGREMNCLIKMPLVNFDEFIDETIAMEKYNYEFSINYDNKREVFLDSFYVKFTKIEKYISDIIKSLQSTLEDMRFLLNQVKLEIKNILADSTIKFTKVINESLEIIEVNKGVIEHLSDKINAYNESERNFDKITELLSEIESV